MRVPLRSTWRWTIALVLLCGGLAASVALEVGAPPPVDPSIFRPSPRQALEGDEGVAETEDELAALTPEPTADHGEIVARPLFQASRRPAAKPSAGSGSAEAVPDSSIQLAGVVLAGGRRLALLQVEASPRPVQVEVGGDVAGWKVAEIEAERVTLRQGDKTKQVTLAERMKAAAALAAASPRQPTKRSPQPERGAASAGKPPGKTAAPPAKTPPAATPPQPQGGGEM
jgi:hypothetical protein